MKTCGSMRAAGVAGFTILELLVSCAVLMLVMVVMLQVTGEVGKIWRSGSGKIGAFQGARMAFGAMTRTLSRATLNTYNDYYDDARKEFRTATANATVFKPTRFSRASELHFVSGPAAALVPGASSATSPGGCVFFQAPMGQSDEADLQGLGRMLNSVGYFIEYAKPDTALMPAWLSGLFGSEYRFRLVQVVVPSESLQVYDSTATTGYDLNWLDAFTVPRQPSAPRFRVLADDVSLLVFRPRLSPQGEQDAAAKLGVPYDPAHPGGMLSPNYHYDSRAWENGYTGGIATPTPERSKLMQNQIPPIVDVAMICLDRQSLGRFDLSNATPPSELAVPPGLFTDATKFSDDLTTYSNQLNAAGIRHRIMQTSVQLQGAKWSAN